jgi:hypothetical protein
VSKGNDPAYDLWSICPTNTDELDQRTLESYRDISSGVAAVKLSTGLENPISWLWRKYDA